MNRLYAAELLKLRTTRSSPALLAAAAVFSAAMAALVALLSAPEDISGQVGGRLVLSSGGIIAGIMALLLAIGAVAGEYRHGTIAPTPLVTPDRRRVLLAQILACTTTGIIVGAVSAAATATVSFPILAARDDVPVALSAAQLAGIVLGGICLAALGAAVGALLRNQVIAVGAALLVLFVAEPLVTELVDGYQRYSLTGLRTAISGGAAESAGTVAGGLPPFWLAALLWTTYTVTLAAAATASSRRDVA